LTFHYEFIFVRQLFHLGVVGGAATFMLICLLVQASQLWYRPRFVVPFLLGLVSGVLGLVFKVEHWAGAHWLLTEGAVVMAAGYWEWLQDKTPYTLLSCLKLALILSVAGYFLALAWWHPGVMAFTGLVRGLFWTVALLYVYQRWIRRLAPGSA
jgi:hypothetical protein